MEHGSKKTSLVLTRMAYTDTREDEQALIIELANIGIRTIAVDYDGDFCISARKASLFASIR